MLICALCCVFFCEQNIEVLRKRHYLCNTSKIPSACMPGEIRPSTVRNTARDTRHNRHDRASTSSSYRLVRWCQKHLRNCCPTRTHCRPLLRLRWKCDVSIGSYFDLAHRPQNLPPFIDHKLPFPIAPPAAAASCACPRADGAGAAPPNISANGLPNCSRSSDALVVA